MREKFEATTLELGSDMLFSVVTPFTANELPWPLACSASRCSNRYRAESVALRSGVRSRFTRALKLALTSSSPALLRKMKPLLVLGVEDVGREPLSWICAPVARRRSYPTLTSKLSHVTGVYCTRAPPMNRLAISVRSALAKE